MKQRAIKIIRPALDLTKRRFEGKKHGITYIGTWYRDGKDVQPCLVLLHGSRPIVSGRTIPCIITLDAAWRWSFHGELGDPEHCGRITREWLADGILPGNPQSHDDCLNVFDVVNTRLPDLIAMPPFPPGGGEKQVIGDIIITNRQTREVTEREMIQDV